MRADAREQLLDREGLGHVVRGAGVEARDLVGHLGAGREHDDRQRRLDRCGSPRGSRGRCGRAASRRGSRGRGRSPTARRPPSTPVGGHLDRMALRAQRALDEVRDAALVLDEKDAHGPIVRRALAALGERTLTRSLGCTDPACRKCSHGPSGTTDAFARPRRRRPSRSRPAAAAPHDGRHRGRGRARGRERERARGGDQAGRLEGDGAGRAARRHAARAAHARRGRARPPPRAPPPQADRRDRGADDDAAAGPDHDRARRSRPRRPRSRRPPPSRRRPRPRSPPAAREHARTPSATLEAIGTTAVVVVEAPAVREAERLLAAELDAIDRACSRFRPDSELMRANDAAGRLDARSSGLFAEAVGVALRAAEQTEGAVDPTVAPALVALGYDRDFAAMDADAADDVRGIPAAGLAQRGARRAAPAAADEPRVPPRSRRDGQGPGRRPRGAAPSPRPPGSPTLVDLGGDVATAGPRPGRRLGRPRDRRPPRRPRRRRARA